MPHKNNDETPEEIERREKKEALDAWTERAENSLALHFLMYWDELTADEEPSEFVYDILRKFGLTPWA